MKKGYLSISLCNLQFPSPIFHSFQRISLSHSFVEFTPSILFFLMGFLPHCTACGISVPDQGLKLQPLHWRCWVLITGQPGKSLDDIINDILFLLSFFDTHPLLVCREATYFCILILYPTNLANSFTIPLSPTGLMCHLMPLFPYWFTMWKICPFI